MPRLFARPRPEVIGIGGGTPLTRVGPLMRCVLESEPWYASPLAPELERTVRASAAQLRDLGQAPEQMVVALKRATARGSRPGFTWNEEHLHYRMILWSVREYFRSAR
jgi:hypothetical protein